MEKMFSRITLHTEWVDALFAKKKEINSVFRDVLGIHEVHHLSITHVNRHGKLIQFSSTPAMAFNLFNSALWQYDRRYHRPWFSQCRQSEWTALYEQDRYDELYYLNQIKHHLPFGWAQAAAHEDDYLIYSFGSRNPEHIMKPYAKAHFEELYAMGQYCTHALYPILESMNQAVPLAVNQKVTHEASY